MARGEKTCPKCNTKTGPRAFSCPKCQYDYNVKKTVKKADKIELELSPEFKELLQKGRKTDYNLIYAPGNSNFSGEAFCPFKLLSSKKEDVLLWLEQISEYVFDSSGNQSKYARVAIEYFVNYFFPMYLKIVNINVNPISGKEEKVIKVIKNEEYFKVLEIVRNNMEPYTKELMLWYK